MYGKRKNSISQVCFLDLLIVRVLNNAKHTFLDIYLYAHEEFFLRFHGIFIFENLFITLLTLRESWVYKYLVYN